MSTTDGIYGSRFSGGGYGGCVVALVQKEMAETACSQIEERFRVIHPELPSKVFVIETGEGLAVVS